MERVGLVANLPPPPPAMQPEIPRNRTRKGTRGGWGDDRRDQQLLSQRLALWQAWIPKGTVPPPCPSLPGAMKPLCLVHHLPLPRTNWQKKAKSSTAYFKMDGFLCGQPQRVRSPCLNSGGHNVQLEECFFEGRLAVRLGSKHLLGTVSLGGFCIERAVRRETSDFCGTSCYQSDVRVLLFRVSRSGPDFSSSASTVWREEEEAP